MNTREQEQCELTSTKMGPQTGGDGNTNIGNIHLLHPRISCTQAPTVAKRKRAPTTSEPTMGDGQHKSELLASTPLCLNPKRQIEQLKKGMRDDANVMRNCKSLSQIITIASLTLFFFNRGRPEGQKASLKHSDPAISTVGLGE